MRNWIKLFEHDEASEDDVWDIIHEFANDLENDTSEKRIYNEVYAEDNQPFPQLFMGGYREDGFSLQAAMQIIQPLVTELSEKGWFLSKRFEGEAVESHAEILRNDPDYDGSPQITIYFGFFPRQGEKELIPQKVYHISPRSNRESILRDGIKARNGGSDFIHTETGRVYVVLDDSIVDSIKKDITKHRGAEWQDLDVWIVDAWSIPEDDWYVDIELAGSAAWTPHDIPASACFLDD